MDHELKNLIQSYEQNLGTAAFYPTEFQFTEFQFVSKDTCSEDSEDNDNEDNDNGDAGKRSRSRSRSRSKGKRSRENSTSTRTRTNTNTSTSNSLDYYKITPDSGKEAEVKTMADNESSSSSSSSSSSPPSSPSWFGRNDSNNSKNNNKPLCSALIDTEEEYMKICINLRRLIARWATLGKMSRDFIAHCLSENENVTFTHHEEYQYQSNTNTNTNTNTSLSSSLADNVLNYTILLESLRKQRHELINNAREVEIQQRQHEKESEPSFVAWVRKKAADFTFMATNKNTNSSSSLNNNNNNNNGQQQPPPLPLTLEDLSAHLSPKYTATNSHYELVMRCFVQSCRDTSSQLKLAKYERKRLYETTNKSLFSIFALMNQCSDQGNPNCRPEQKIYHTLISSNREYATMGKALESLNLLLSMIEKRKLGSYDAKYWPNNHTYNSTLLGFQDVPMYVRDLSLEQKLQLLDHCESILDEMEDDDTIVPPISQTNDREDSPYQIILNMICHFERKDIRACLDRVDGLMSRMMGEEAYVSLCTCPNEAIGLPPRVAHGVHPKIFKHLVHLFACTEDAEYINRSRVILDKMITARDHQRLILTSTPTHGQDESNIATCTSTWDTDYPDRGSFNTFISGLLHQAIYMHSLKSDESKYFQHQLVGDALYAAGLLDSMIENESSEPIAVTYHRLIHLWTFCKSKRSGEVAEEILSKMNIHAAISSNVQNFEYLLPKTYQSVFDCWTTSAQYGYPGVPRRVEQLINRMNAQQLFDVQQSQRPSSSQSGERNSNSITSKEKNYIYCSAMKCCSETCLDEDKQDALRVALDIYNKMQQEELAPSTFLYFTLLKCCNFAPVDDRQRLYSKIFQEACAEGLVTKGMLSFLRKVNLPLVEAYEQKSKESYDFATSSSQSTSESTSTAQAKIISE